MPLSIAVLIALLVAVVAAPAPAAAQGGQTPVCHYTGDSESPYVLLMLGDELVEGHIDHDLDLIPPPPTGCPDAQVTDPDEEPEPSPTPAESVTICHEGIGRAYETLTVTRGELDIHADHERDIIPAPADGCPRHSSGSGGDRQGDGGRDRDRDDGAGAGPQPGAAPTLSSAPAAVSATGQMPDSLPVTGGHPGVLALLGLSLVLSGAGMRLRLLSRS